MRSSSTIFLLDGVLSGWFMALLSAVLHKPKSGAEKTINQCSLAETDWNVVWATGCRCRDESRWHCCRHLAALGGCCDKSRRHRCCRARQTMWQEQAAAMLLRGSQTAGQEQVVAMLSCRWWTADEAMCRGDSVFPRGGRLRTRWWRCHRMGGGRGD